jgi:hypothetical protein
MSFAEVEAPKMTSFSVPPNNIVNDVQGDHQIKQYLDDEKAAAQACSFGCSWIKASCILTDVLAYGMAKQRCVTQRVQLVPVLNRTRLSNSSKMQQQPRQQKLQQQQQQSRYNKSLQLPHQGQSCYHQFSTRPLKVPDRLLLCIM